MMDTHVHLQSLLYLQLYVVTPIRNAKDWGNIWFRYVWIYTRKATVIFFFASDSMISFPLPFPFPPVTFNSRKMSAYH